MISGGVSQGKRDLEGWSLTGVHLSMSWGPWGLILHPFGLLLWKYCRPLFLLPSVFPSIRVFSKELVLCIRWPKYWSFSFSISPSNEYQGLISFRMDWFHLLAVQGTLKSLLQHHSFKASALSLLLVQLSHPYMTTGKTIALTRWTFAGKVMSLLFNMLSRYLDSILKSRDLTLLTKVLLVNAMVFPVVMYGCES